MFYIVYELMKYIKSVILKVFGLYWYLDLSQYKLISIFNSDVNSWYNT